MQNPKSVIITGTGMQVPERVVTNHDLAALMDTSDEWIRQRSGIEQRRYVSEGETPSDLAEGACLAALKMAGLKATDMDLLLVCTLSPEHYFPGTGAFLQKKLGMETKPTMDIRAQCSGFLFALTTARSLILSGQYRRILLCGVEIHSRALDFSTEGRDVAVLFGDGAGAVILEASARPEAGIISCHLHSEGEHAKRLWVEAPRFAASPIISADMIEARRTSPQMDGKFVFKQAVTRLPEVISEALGANHLTHKDIDHYFFHQANLRINEYVCQTMGIEVTKTRNNIQKYGNCSAASIPMCLDEANRAGLLRRGELLCLAAFGSGFSWGSALIRW